MKKSDLKSGMVVKTLYGTRYFVTEIEDKLYLLGEEDVFSLNSYKEDMTHPFTAESIVEVYEGTARPISDILNTVGEVLWTRDDTKEITVSEAFRVLKEHYGSDVRIVEE